jgi:hypothetical protein
MIISHKHKFVFVAVPKTGTHSVRRALRDHMGPDDLEQVRLFVEKKFPWPELASLQHGHLSLTQVRPFMEEESFCSFFKFAFVRNPFDRFVSYCAFTTREIGAFDRDPKGVMRHMLFRAPPMRHILFQPQYSFVADANGELLTDAIGRVEEMQQSYDAMCARIGIPTKQLEKANSSRHGDYRQYYDQQLIDGVAKMYGKDLSLFGYEF